MKKLVKLTSLVLSLILIICAVTGCQKKTSDIEYPYKIFYINSSGSSIVPIGYAPSARDDDTLNMVDEFMGLLRNPMSNDQAAVPPLSANLNINKVLVDKNTISIDFGPEYLSLDKYNELLIRAAVVRTLGQIEGIETIFFTVNDAPITDTAGSAIGGMTMDSFATIQNDSNLDKRKLEVKLYFSTLSGENLVTEKRKVTYSSNVPLGKAVIDELIHGSRGKDGIDVIPKGTEVLGLYVENGVCYVNFSKPFAKGLPGIEAMTTIYAITNSLAELPNINKVRIIIENDPNIKYMDTISLNQTFERNLDIIQGE